MEFFTIQRGEFFGIDKVKSLRLNNLINRIISMIRLTTVCSLVGGLQLNRELKSRLDLFSSESLKRFDVKGTLE